METLDGRIVPDASSVVVPEITPPDQSPVSEQQVTDVAVIPQVDVAGNATGVAIILEKAGNVYVVSFYDTYLNSFYTGTDSLGTSLQLDASPELDQLIQFAGGIGDRTTLQFTDANGQLVPNPLSNSGLPPMLAQLPGQLPGAPASAPAILVIPGFLQQPNTPIQWYQAPSGQIYMGQQPQTIAPPVGLPPLVMPNQPIAQQYRLGQNLPIIRNILFPPQPQRFIQFGNGGVWIRTR